MVASEGTNQLGHLFDFILTTEFISNALSPWIIHLVIAFDHETKFKTMLASIEVGVGERASVAIRVSLFAITKSPPFKKKKKKTGRQLMRISSSSSYKKLSVHRLLKKIAYFLFHRIATVFLETLRNFPTN